MHSVATRSPASFTDANATGSKVRAVTAKDGCAGCGIGRGFDQAVRLGKHCPDFNDTALSSRERRQREHPRS